MLREAKRAIYGNRGLVDKITDHARELPIEDTQTFTYVLNKCQLCKYGDAIQQCQLCRKNLCFECVMKH